jgi:hypothetical protein
MLEIESEDTSGNAAAGGYLEEVSAGSLHRRDLRIHLRVNEVPFLDLVDSFVKLSTGSALARTDDLSARLQAQIMSAYRRRSSGSCPPISPGWQAT